MTANIARNSEPRKTKYHHGDLRRELLSAAEAELADKGVEAFSLRGVAKRAGVSHAAPARHFRDAGALLTELATQGYERFISAQESRQKNAPKDAKSQLAASGLGYIDFALSHTALFRLMFSSERPDRSAKGLSQIANLAFEKLVADIHNVTSIDPHADPSIMSDVLATWAVTHGLADLMASNRLGRANFFNEMKSNERDAFFSEVILCACTKALK